MKFEKIDITKENINPFQRIGQDWMLISAEREGKVNTMTASWGMMGANRRWVILERYLEEMKIKLAK